VLRTLVLYPEGLHYPERQSLGLVSASQGVLTLLTEPDGDFSPWLGLVNRDHRVISRDWSRGRVVVDMPTASAVGG